jgi:hypothetical protein
MEEKFFPFRVSSFIQFVGLEVFLHHQRTRRAASEGDAEENKSERSGRRERKETKGKLDFRLWSEK